MREEDEAKIKAQLEKEHAAVQRTFGGKSKKDKAFGNSKGA